MRIALFLPHLGVSGGLGVHCRGLFAALLRTCPDHTFAVLAPADPKQLFPLSGLEDGWRPLTADPRVTFVPLDWPAGLSLAAPQDPALAGPLASVKPDALLCSYYTGMQAPPCPQAIVFHDAGFLDNPEVFGETARVRRATVETIRPAIARLVCVSADAKARICAKLPFDPDRADVVHHALSDTPEAMAEAVRTEAPGGSAWGRYFFLPVGAATGFNRRRKNVPTAVAAFRQLGVPDVRLVIASTGVLNETMMADLLPESERAGGAFFDDGWHSADGGIVVLPNLDRGPFLAAMAHAVGVVYPSRYEGFGLPTIEGMALGVPVIAGKATSLPEVVGDAGLLVDPDDAPGFAAAMRTVLTEPSAVLSLVARGRERVGRYSLEAMGTAMRAVFERLAG